MKKIIKRILYTLLTLVVLIMIVVIALPFVIDPNDYKPEIQELAKKHTGRDLTIPGKIKLSVFPWLGFELGAVQLHNPSGFKQPHFAEFEHAKAHVKLMSLFSDQIEIGELEINGLQMNLQKQPNGHDNWSDLNRSDATPAPEKTTAPVQDAKSAKRFRIDAVALHDAVIRYDDEQAKQHWLVKDVNIQTGPLQEHQPVPLSVRLHAQQPAQKTALTLDLQTQLTMNLAAQHFTLNQLKLHSTATGLLPNKNTVVTLQVPELQMDFTQQHINIPGFMLELDSIKSSGKFSLSKFDASQIRFNLDIANLDLNTYLPPPDDKPTATATTTSVKSEPLNIAIPPQLDIQGTLNIQQMQVREINVRNISLPVTIKQGRAQLNPAMELYEGKYQGEWQLNTQTQPVRWQMQHHLQGVAFGPLVKAISQKDVVRGKAELDAKLTMQGLTPDEIQRSLNGEGRLRISQPQFVNLELRNWILGRYYDLLKKPRPTETKDVTVFDEITASFSVKNGVVHNPDMLARAERNQLTGAGTVDLVNQSIDYTVQFISKTSYVIKLGDSEYDLKDEPIPIPIQGQWAELGVPKPDVGEVIKRIQKRSLQKKVDTQKEKLQQKTEDKKQELKDKLLKKLLK